MTQQLEISPRDVELITRADWTALLNIELALIYATMQAAEDTNDPALMASAVARMDGVKAELELDRWQVVNDLIGDADHTIRDLARARLQSAEAAAAAARAIYLP
jgi:hypothetical protein